jgi:phosphopantothenoylcysteine decarboxylase/phosphopantothenate--cysteine ligase
MLTATRSASAQADALLMAAAVADYRPDAVAAQKIKKGQTDLALRMVRTDDILSTIAEDKRATGFPRVTVGFAAESQDLIENARVKLTAKGLDLIVANDITAPDAGFGAATNRVVLVKRNGDTESLPLMTKDGVAHAVLDQIVRMLMAPAAS